MTKLLVTYKIDRADVEHCSIPHIGLIEEWGPKNVEVSRGIGDGVEARLYIHNWDDKRFNIITYGYRYKGNYKFRFGLVSRTGDIIEISLEQARILYGENERSRAKAH